MSLLDASSLSRTEISSTVGEEDDDEEDEEEWLSCFIGVRGVDKIQRTNLTSLEPR